MKKFKDKKNRLRHHRRRRRRRRHRRLCFCCLRRRRQCLSRRPCGHRQTRCRHCLSSGFWAADPKRMNKGER